jgi:nucleoside-diphosphate kinase
MPSKSESQKRLFCMAYAVRKGKLKRSEVHKSVLDIVDGNMTDQEIKDFMVKECGLTEYIRESLYDTQYANGGTVKFKDPKYLLVIVKPQFLDLTAEIMQRIGEAGFDIKRVKTTQLTLQAARSLYKIHKDKDFYKPLCEYMASGPSTALLVYPSDPEWKEKKAVNRLSKLKDEVRDTWGESEKLNVMHSSDSYAAAAEEARSYFF